MHKTLLEVLFVKFYFLFDKLAKGITKFHYDRVDNGPQGGLKLVTDSGCFSFALVGNAAGWPSPTLLKMRAGEASLTMDVTQTSWMVSMMYLGHLVSPVPSGLAMDRFGRKGACLLLSALPLVSWLLIRFTTTPESLYLARFVAGLWAGATSTIVPIYVGEIAEPRLRGSLTVMNHLMRNFGVLLVYIVGPYVSYNSLATSCAVLTLAYIFALSAIPESPYFLLMRGREKEACESLSWLRGGRDREVEKEMEVMKSALKEQLRSKGSFKDVWFNKGNRKALIISEVYAVSKRLTGAGVLQAYVSVTLPSMTFGMFNPDDCVIILGVVSLLSAAGSVVLSVYINRRSLITFSSAGCAITMAMVSVWFYLNSNTNVDVRSFSDWLFICYIVYNATFSLGLGPVGTSIKGELFAANVKAICSSITTILVAVTSFILNKFFLIIAHEFGMYVNFLIYAMSCVFAIVFTWVYVPDTQGKSLEEIQQIFQGSNEKKKRS